MDILQESKNNQRRIGLTGGIASGKTTITNYIRKHKKIPILDADKLSRELTKPNTYGYKKILDYFGNEIIDNKNNSEGAINRKLLRNIIFKQSESKEWIEKLLHPLIKEKMLEDKQKLAKKSKQYNTEYNSYIKDLFTIHRACFPDLAVFSTS